MINLQIGKPLDIYLPNIYRYMDKEHIDKFFNEGILRISSFKRFKEYPDEIRGDKNEGNGSVIGTSDTSGFQFHVMSNIGQGAYLLCGSIIESDTLKKTFETQSCFRIVKPLDFSIAISNAVLGFKQSYQGFCNYREHRVIKKLISSMDINDCTGPEGTIILGGQKGNQRTNEIIGNGIDLMFLKERKYQTQCEYRFIWKINTLFYPIADYLDIQCNEAIQFCERI